MFIFGGRVKTGKGGLAAAGARIFLDALYPRRCPVCGEIVMPKGRLICPGCIRKLSWITGPACMRCGKELLSEQAEYCPDCMRRRRDFDAGMALLSYSDAARESLAKVKYHGRREYLDFYGEAMAAGFGARIARLRPDAIVPVPVHPSRRRKRGFNQAEILAGRLARGLEERTGVSVPVRPEYLCRVRRTAPQKDLSPEERRKNLERAFAPGLIPAGVRTVLLVDDIYTTGSTAEACAKALKAGGAERVCVAVICISR